MSNTEASSRGPGRKLGWQPGGAHPGWHTRVPVLSGLLPGLDTEDLMGGEQSKPDQVTEVTAQGGSRRLMGSSAPLAL